MKALKESLYELLENYEKKAERKNIGMSDVQYVQQIINLLRDLKSFECDKKEAAAIQPELPSPSTIMTRATNPGY